MTKEEIEQAEKFLDAYLGGNRNVSTLTWKHWIECLADYGKKLQSENERLKAEREWISVEEQKPLTDEIIHVWHRNELKKGKRCIVGNNELWHYEGESRLSYEEPTHWMPLPKSPEI